MGDEFLDMGAGASETGTTETVEIVETEVIDVTPVIYDIGSAISACILYGAFLVVGCLIGLKLIGGVRP